MKVAFIGLGIMGSRMAANLLKNSIELSVYNRSPEPVEKLVKQGAKTNTSIQEVVKDANIVYTMLSTPEVVKSVMVEGNDAVLDYLKEDSIWVDCSTVNPSFSKSMEIIAKQKQIRFVDAPVAGTKPHAENGELVFFVGGNEKDIQVITPHLNMMGKKAMHIGEVSEGASFKMLVNIMLAQSMIIFSEAVVLGEKMGLDKSFLLNTLPNLVVSAPFTKFKASMISKNNYDVQFPLEWMYKDLHLASQTAYENEHPLFLANLAKELYAKGIEQGLGRLDFSAIHKLLENNTTNKLEKTAPNN